MTITADVRPGRLLRIGRTAGAGPGRTGELPEYQGSIRASLLAGSPRPGARPATGGPFAGRALPGVVS